MVRDISITYGIVVVYFSNVWAGHLVNAAGMATNLNDRTDSFTAYYI